MTQHFVESSSEAPKDTRKPKIWRYKDKTNGCKLALEVGSLVTFLVSHVQVPSGSLPGCSRAFQDLWPEAYPAISIFRALQECFMEIENKTGTWQERSERGCKTAAEMGSSHWAGDLEDSLEITLFHFPTAPSQKNFAKREKRGGIGREY